MVMWYIFNYNHFFTYNKHTSQPLYLIKTPLFIIYIYIYKLKQWSKYIYSNYLLNLKNIFYITLETKIINIKYIGKIFKIKKKKKIFILLLNYNGFNYLIWKNLAIKRRKRRKRIIFFYWLTNNNLKFNFYYNLIRLRVLNTYTKRGVYNNIFIYYWRKRKLLTHR